MKKYYVIVFLLAFLQQKVCSQVCLTPDVNQGKHETLPWYGNNAYLYELLDTEGYSTLSDYYAQAIVAYTEGKPRDDWDAFYRIPVNIVFYNTGDLTTQEKRLKFAQILIDRLNYIYSGTVLKKYNYLYDCEDQTGIDWHLSPKFNFYLYCNYINYINQHITSDGYVGEYSGLDQNDLILQNNVDGVLNIHIFSDTNPDIDFGLCVNCASYSEGDKNKRFIVLNNKFFLFENDDEHRVTCSTPAHEVGHYFKLPHTFEGDVNKICDNPSGYSRHEVVNRQFKVRKNSGGYDFCDCSWTTELFYGCRELCEYAGDLICDTNADMYYLGVNSPSNSCNFLGYGNEDAPNQFDLEKEDKVKNKYKNNPPNTRNIMSYARPYTWCRNQFSWGQVGIMNDAVQSGLFDFSNLTDDWNNPNSPAKLRRFDIHEPDGHPAMARAMQIGEMTHHTFHWSTKDNAATHQHCDTEDWVTFTIGPEHKGVLEITTSEGHYDPADTELLLYTPAILNNPNEPTDRVQILGNGNIETRGAVKSLQTQDVSVAYSVFRTDQNQDALKIYGNGRIETADNICARRVRVQLDAPACVYPDYVFAPDYRLRPLCEVGEYIRENGRLPDVPSAQDAAQNGIDLTDMNLTLLRKVEELTLYVIELEKRLEKLDAATR